MADALEAAVAFETAAKDALDAANKTREEKGLPAAAKPTPPKAAKKSSSRPVRGKKR